MEATTPIQVVLRLIDTLNGKVPRQRASEYLDQFVTMHVDSAIFRGIENWQKWIHLIRNCGRVRDLQMVPCEASPDSQDPCVVNLAIRWSGIRGSDHLPSTTPQTYPLRFRIKDNRIVEIWSRKANYVFIFGRWIRFAVMYRLFLGWAILYFASLTLRGIDYRCDRAV